MAFLKVANLGTPVLRQRAQEVAATEIKSEKFQQFLDDLIETMQEYDGYGLAAPQVFVSKRVFVYQILNNPDPEDKNTVPLKVMINPVLSQFSSESESDWEGCLSLPNLRGLVERPSGLTVEALDRHGQKQKFKAKGFHARVIQHEFDHLEGKVFVDRMSDFSSLSFLDEHLKYQLKE